jgi:hypothetical protein
MRPKFIFEGKDANDEQPLFIDGKLMNDAVATEVASGPLRGIHMFSNRARAEEWCWKQGADPVFPEGEAT